MSIQLLEKLKQARQSRVQCGEITFIITRPTDQDMAYANRVNLGQKEIFSKFVIGWEGVKEIDIIDSGDSTPAEFSPELFASWIEDKPDYWQPIAQGVKEAYKKHVEKRADALKN